MTSELGGLEGMTLFLDLDVVLVDNIRDIILAKPTTKQYIGIIRRFRCRYFLKSICRTKTQPTPGVKPISGQKAPSAPIVARSIASPK